MNMDILTVMLITKRMLANLKYFESSAGINHGFKVNEVLHHLGLVEA